MIAKSRALNPETCRRLICTENLPKQVHDSLHKYYVQQENTTGIPAEVYANAIAEDQLRGMMTAAISGGFAYLNGTAETVKTDISFSVLESDLTAFFNQYAEENGYEKDAVFHETLAKAIEAGKSNISVATDVFRFASLEDAGVLKKARNVLPLLPKLMIACIAADVVLLVILLVMYRKRVRDAIYWVAASIFCASNLMLVPALWIEKNQWFDRFAVKSAQIFAAVTGYLYGITGTVIKVGVAGIVLAVILWIVRMIGKKEENERKDISAKHNF